MPDPSLPPRVALTSSVALALVSSGRNLMRNDSLPGSSSAYSVYASCVNRRPTGALGLSEPSGFVPPGNCPPPRPCCAAIRTGRRRRPPATRTLFMGGVYTSAARLSAVALAEAEGWRGSLDKRRRAMDDTPLSRRHPDARLDHRQRSAADARRGAAPPARA